MTCKICDERLTRVLTEAEDAHESAQNLIREITGKRYFASYECGNFKRQMWSKSDNFKTLEEGKQFVIDGIGSLQGQGSVLLDGESVWEYFPDQEEREYREMMLELEYA